MNTCQVQDVNGEICGRRVAAHGLCGTHYTRSVRGQALDAPIKKTGPGHGPSVTICTVEGCDKKVNARGLCPLHYGRWKRGSKVEGPARTSSRTGEPCKVEGCGRTDIAGLGLCRKHYQRQRRHGDPTKLLINERGTGGWDAEGYRQISVDGKRMKEHRHVMEQHLGRKLLPEETVHHRRGRDANQVENLRLWSGNHPTGHSIPELVAWAREIIGLYGELVDANDIVVSVEGSA